MPTGLQLTSTVTSSGRLKLTLESVETPPLGENDILIEVQASPINPSDLGLLLSTATIDQGETREANGQLTFEAPIPEATLPGLSARLDKPMTVGNEGAGIVVDAGVSADAQAMIGRTVGVFGGSMYAQYRVADARSAMVLPEGVSARQGASPFVNPMTTLAFLETMHLEGHSAIVHTAAASNLGQMLVKLCQHEDVPLVNVVRAPEHAALLESLGASNVVVSSENDFRERLVAAITETGATLGFDAVGGGTLADQLLAAMEAAASSGDAYNRYGSTTHKQVYIYGSLDPSTTILKRSYGMSWGVGGWLVMNLLQRVGAERSAELRNRVSREITTTFASSYSDEISLSAALQSDNIRAYQRKATGRKFLINPSLG